MTKEKTKGIYLKVSEQELDLIHKRMELANIHNRSAYLRKMAINGYVINLDIPELQECSRSLRSVANNVNQIARRCNSGGVPHARELRELKQELYRCTREFGNINERLARIS